MAVTYNNLKFWDGTAPALSDLDSITTANGRITHTGEIPPGSEVRDMGGLYATPGLIDAHVHLCLNPEVRDPLAHGLQDKNITLAQIRERVALMLRSGITTARDLGGGAYLELQVRDEVNAGATPGCRLICSGQPITSVQGHCHFWGGEAGSQDEALAVLERQHQMGVDLIKVMATGGNMTPGSTPADSQFDLECLKAIVNTASAHGYHVAAHCHGTQGIGFAAKAGVTTVEHCSWVGKQGWGKSFDLEVVQNLAEQNVWVSPTINAGWHRFRDKKEFVEMIQANYKAMRAAGVQLIASTDAGIPNVFHHDLAKALPEFAFFAGLTNVEVLRAATSDCAKAIGLNHETGRIAPGLSADLVFYEANPLEDLSQLQCPVQVMFRGECTTL